MVVPVPVVLDEEHVKTLPREVFDRVDRLAAPRLVEYWEEDPCAPVVEYEMMAMASGAGYAEDSAEEGGLGVRIEAQFAVGEYDIVILSANDSAGLETWLHRENYNIPDGANEVLRPYVEAGTKFFVAKVNVERVTFQDGRALLSPLRVHYDTPEFSLPVRLGLLNSHGQQDLIVHILAPNRRYEVANYENAPIPSNIRVKNEVREEFGQFYEYLFRETVAHHPRTVVTEYSWDASSCDPCPTPALDSDELATLGADVLPNGHNQNYVLTRLHYRYSSEDLGEDLVFRQAEPLEGGRGIPSPDGVMMPTQIGRYQNQFQGRYVILHPWENEVSCESPSRGRWGGPQNGASPAPMSAPNTVLTQGVPSAAPDGARYLDQDVPEIEARAADGGEAPSEGTETGTNSNGSGSTATTPPSSTARGGCAGCAASGSSDVGSLLALSAMLGLAFAIRRRTR